MRRGPVASSGRNQNRDNGHVAQEGGQKITEDERMAKQRKKAGCRVSNSRKFVQQDENEEWMSGQGVSPGSNPQHHDRAGIRCSRISGSLKSLHTNVLKGLDFAMLRREYGIATPSSLAPPVHAEDVQPNEAIDKKRGRNLPPSIKPTAPPTIHSSGGQYRGGFRARGAVGGWRNVSQRGGSHVAQNSNAMHRNSSWRGQGSNWYGIGHSSARPRMEDKFAMPNEPSDSGWPRGVSSNFNSTENGTVNPAATGVPSGSSITPALPIPTGPRSLQLRTQPPSPRPRSPPPSSTPTSPRFKRRKLEQDQTGQLAQRAGDELKSALPAQAACPTASTLIPVKSIPLVTPTPTLLPVKREQSPTPALHPLPIQTKVKKEEETPVKLESVPSPEFGPSQPLRQAPGSSNMKQEESLPVPPAPDRRKTKPPSTTPIKQERLSPTPPPQRRLIKESCNFYPFPEWCKKSNPNYRDNRKAFFLEKNKDLVKLGLKKTKVFSRDDGLVIEWTSKVPVWSDTFKPEHPKVEPNTPEIIDLT